MGLLMSLNQLVIPYATFMAVSLGAVAWRGGAPERLGAVVMVVMVAFQMTMEKFIPSEFNNVDISSLGTDIIGLVGFGAIALHARRMWPLWATALQIVCLGAHFSRWASITMSPVAYALIRSVPTAVILLLLLAATVRCVVARRRGQVDVPWQDWSMLAWHRGRN